MNPFFDLIIAKDKSELCRLTVRKWMAIAREAIRHRKRFVVAISGGKSPAEFYRAWAQKNKAQNNKKGISSHP